VKEIRVLLVDDEEELVQTLVERLRFRGLDAEGVTTGKKALERLVVRRFDVVVADLKMPSVDGRLIEQIVKERYPGTRVLLMTGHGAQEDEIPADTEYLLKPFSIETLLSRIMDTEPGDGQVDAR
jgi:two-component system OmpR family response regulator